MKKVNVIVPSFNTKDQTVRVIKQLLLLGSTDIDIEVILIENGSADGTPQELKKIFGEETQYEKCKIKFALNNNNIGFTKAINQGIMLSYCPERTPDYFVFLNTDVDILKDSIFTDMVNVLEDHHEFGCLIFNDSVIGSNVDKRIKWLNENVGITDEGMWYCVMVPSRSIHNIGVLDDRFWLHCSDSDYQIRCHQAGKEVGVIRNTGHIKHMCFGSSRFLQHVHTIIEHDRKEFNQKWLGVSDLHVTKIIPEFPIISYHRISPSPYLSILTRCYKRPNLVAKCRQSVLNQTDQDFEQIFIVDTVGHDLAWANNVFNLVNNQINIRGKYVMFLDDDDELCYNDLIADLKAVTNDHDYAAIIWRGNYHGRMVPGDASWQRREPTSCDISSFCFAVRHNVYRENIAMFGSDKAIGDFKFIRTVYEKNINNIGWLDKLAARTQRPKEGSGLPE